MMAQIISMLSLSTQEIVMNLQNIWKIQFTEGFFYIKQ